MFHAAIGKLSLRKKLMILATVGVFLPVLVLTYMQYQSLAELQDKTKGAFKDNLRQGLTLVERRMKQRLEWIAAQTLDPIGSIPLFSPGAAEEFEKHFAKVKQSHPEIEEIIFFGYSTDLQKAKTYAYVYSDRLVRIVQPEFSSTQSHTLSLFEKSQVAESFLDGNHKYLLAYDSCQGCPPDIRRQGIYLFYQLPYPVRGQPSGFAGVFLNEAFVRDDLIGRSIFETAPSHISSTAPLAMAVTISDENGRVLYSNAPVQNGHFFESNFDRPFPNCGPMATLQVLEECRHMRVQLKHCLMTLLLCLNASEGAGHSIPQRSSGTDGRHQLSRRASEWTRVVPGKGTSCSDGSRYSFFVRPGDPKRLLIYFQGGGACWSSATCDLNQKFYRRSLDDVAPQTELGVFDFSNRENPFQNYTVVFIPYCTGDAHLGNRTVTYRLPGENSKPGVYTVRHNGYVNSSAVLRWIFAKFSPNQIFVAGGSAGAIASPFYTGRIAEKYKDARIIQLGDSAGGLRSPLIPSILNNWGTTRIVRPLRQYRGEDNLTFEKLYVVEGRQRPWVVFSQFNNSQDAVQIAGHRQTGIEKVSLVQLLELTYSDVRKVVPTFRTFTAPGTLHVMLNRPEFYTLEVRGVRLRDWVADLASGRTVNSVNSED